MTRALATTLAAIAVMSALACDPSFIPGSGPDFGSDKPELCAFSRSARPIRARDRKILGPASPLSAADDEVGGAMDGVEREARLAGSQRERRALGWRVFEKLVAPVSIAEALPMQEQDGLRLEVPRFRTWYEREDFERMWKRLYLDLGPDGRKERRPFGDDALRRIEEKNVRAVEGSEAWSRAQYLEELAEIDDAAKVGGLAGHARVLYDPSSLLTILSAYPALLECQAERTRTRAKGGATAPAFTSDVAEPWEQVHLRESGALSSCERAVFGPFAVAPGATFEVTMQGDGDADLTVREDHGQDTGEDLCRSRSASSEEHCVVEGGGLRFVIVEGYGASSSYALEIEYVESAADRFAPCLGKELPKTSAVVKTLWQRAEFGNALPVYDTSSERLASRLRGHADWGPGDGFADPGADEIYTVRVPNGNLFRLAAMHVMTKELRHWTWSTYWWSPNADVDFGADRPHSLEAPDSPWRNYKMCTVTAFREKDPSPSGGFGADEPTLAAALTAVHAGEGGPSWCSNPYLEEGPINANTNCIGCHQHAGTGLGSSDVLSHPERFPHEGRTKVRNNFPADYLFTLTEGDSLVRVIADEALYYDSFE